MEIKKEIQALVDKIDGKLLAIASSETKDRIGDIVVADGWKLGNFKKNPVLLFAHNYTQPPIGLAKNIRIDGKNLVFEPVFHSITQLAREIKAMFESEPPIMRAFSVGFMPLKTDEKNSHVITEQELLEISAVPVPANQEALIQVASKSITVDEQKAVEEWVKVEQELCEGVKIEESEMVNAEIKPYPNEHACRLNDPGKYDKFARKNCEIKHADKCIDVIYGIKEGKSEIQAMRYPKDIWTEDSAKSHCKAHDGTFEPASEEKGCTCGDKPAEEPKVEEQPKVEETPKPDEQPKVEESKPDVPVETVKPDVPVEIVKPIEESEELEKPVEVEKIKAKEGDKCTMDNGDEGEMHVDDNGDMVCMSKKKKESDTEMEELKQLVVDLKQGRKLSSKDRKLVEDTISLMKEATSALRRFLVESEPAVTSGEGKSLKGRQEVAQKPLKDKVMVRALQKIARETSRALNEAKKTNE